MGFGIVVVRVLVRPISLALSPTRAEMAIRSFSRHGSMSALGRLC
jgi:hypothetical protein